MKKTTNKFLMLIWFAFLIIMVTSLMASVVSCKAKPIEKTHTLERITQTKLDSTTVIAVSRAIQDSLLIQINKIKSAKPECDSLINNEIKNTLQRLNNIKKSGNNEFGIFYDALKNQVIVYANIKESIEKDTRVLKALLEQNKEFKTQTIEVKVYPKWLVYLAILGGLFILFIGFRFSKIFM
jgi:hypothetical protein